MRLANVYHCLADPTRLRILNLLLDGPLCVCHVEAVLAEPQANISKHLRCLRANGFVECSKAGNWRIYALPLSPTPIIEAGLRTLRDCAAVDAECRADSRKLRKMRRCITGRAPLCHAKPESRRKAA